MEHSVASNVGEVHESTTEPAVDMQDGQDSDVSECDNSEKDKGYTPATVSGSEPEVETLAIRLLNSTISDHIDTPKTSNKTEEEARATHSLTENNLKRKCHPMKWKKIILKRKLNMGVAYESPSEKHIGARKVGSPCGEKGRMR
ncbi:hypothetical protein PR048_015867 [Dryococelus australis]|uniref:Uncharacterized protein n=1 Tax=Dryococelus australis TaxID=614101 RepID=A0ABQ9HI41_9NEOP|nr:hypothetical protein PR048_015867 [Dryococelus australis]